MTGFMGSLLSGLLAEQAGGAEQQHDDHDHEDDHGGRFGVDDLGQALDEAQPEAR
jgi:hypothetical protein